MRVAVTGSAGFIGSRLANQLLGSGHSVLGIDNLSLGQSAPAAQPGLEFHRLDVRDEIALSGVFEAFRPEHVIHLAAIHHIPTCEARPAEALHVNVVGTQIVLEATARAGCRRAVIASSGAVYAWGTEILREETSPTQPCDVYSASKLMNEQQARIWADKNHATVVAARLFNTIGPGDRNGHLVPQLLSQLRGNGDCGERVVRIGNTVPMRDYVYVDDVAHGLLRMAEVGMEPGFHVINLGSGIEHTVSKIVDELAVIVGVQYRLESDPSRVRKVDRLHQCADISRAADVLGWRPSYGLGDALRRTVEEV
jgi:UDP-glucose 4-epimerase